MIEPPHHRSLLGLKATYTGQKLIYAARDLLDAVVSIQRLHVGRKSWLENNAIPAIE